MTDGLMDAAVKCFVDLSAEDRRSSTCRRSHRQFRIDLTWIDCMTEAHQRGSQESRTAGNLSSDSTSRMEKV